MGKQNQVAKTNQDSKDAVLVDFAGFENDEMVFVTEEQALQMAEGLKQLAETGEKIEITMKSITFDIGEEQAFIFMGNTIMNGDSGKVPALRLLGDDGNMYINANTMLVGNISGLKPGTPINVICTDEVKSKVGKYKEFKVQLLRPLK